MADLGLARWRLGDCIGEGGFGRVYEATADQDVAVVKFVEKLPGADRTDVAQTPFVVSPPRLDRRSPRSSIAHGAVVVCSRSFEHVRGAEATILLLRAEAVDSVIHSRDETIVNPRLSDVLRAIDRAVPPREPDTSDR